jgi:hypothetical protein
MYGTARFWTFILVGKRLHCDEVGSTTFGDVESRCLVDSYGRFGGVSETFRRDILSSIFCHEDGGGLFPRTCVNIYHLYHEIPHEDLILKYFDVCTVHGSTPACFDASASYSGSLITMGLHLQDSPDCMYKTVQIASTRQSRLHIQDSPDWIYKTVQIAYTRQSRLHKQPPS